MVLCSPRAERVRGEQLSAGQHAPAALPRTQRHHTPATAGPRVLDLTHCRARPWWPGLQDKAEPVCRPLTEAVASAWPSVAPSLNMLRVM